MAKGVYHIIGNYYITVDPNQYTVAQMKTNKKTGKDSLDYLTYHGDLQSAIKSLHRIAVQDSLSGSEGDLRDAMRNLFIRNRKPLYGSLRSHAGNCGVRRRTQCRELTA